MTLIRQLARVSNRIWANNVRFFAVFLAVVTLTYGVLYAADFIPEAPDTSAATASSTATSDDVLEPVDETPAVTAPAPTDATPDRIIIDKLGKDLPIANPTSDDVNVLNNALLTGVARHPDSADLLTNGTVLIFGHSSYLPVVHNKNFQNFNGIQNLEWGDKIRLQSADYEYVYRVDRVYKAKASTGEITIATGEHTLALVTCNSFGTKEDRYVVEATLVDSYPL
jgi:LPXTG-site transpeptidase (sortase) family protein